MTLRPLKAYSLEHFLSEHNDTNFQSFTHLLEHVLFGYKCLQRATDHELLCHRDTSVISNGELLRRWTRNRWKKREIMIRTLLLLGRIKVKIKHASWTFHLKYFRFFFSHNNIAVFSRFIKYFSFKRSVWYIIPGVISKAYFIYFVKMSIFVRNVLFVQFHGIQKIKFVSILEALALKQNFAL